jgi:hypothetical protein
MAHFVNKHYEDYASDADHKDGMIRVSGVQWFTNMDISKRHEKMILYRTFNEKDYPKYENYDAIEVSNTKDIPMDYKGVMGVPVTFMNKFNPEQFELIGMGEDNGTGHSGGIWKGGSKSCLYNGKAAYKRLFIRNKEL